MPNYQCSPDRYNDTALGERPPRTEYKKSDETKGQGPASAKGRPSGVKESDGTDSPRVTVQTKQAATPKAEKGSKNYPKGVTSYSDGSV